MNSYKINSYQCNLPWLIDFISIVFGAVYSSSGTRRLTLDLKIVLTKVDLPRPEPPDTKLPSFIHR